MKNDLLIVVKGNKDKVDAVLEEIDNEIKGITGKGYAVREIKSVPDAKKQLPKGDDSDKSSV